MNLMKLVTLWIIAFLLWSCNASQSYYFYDCEYTLIENNCTVEKVVHQRDLTSIGENYNIFNMTIYDSIAVLMARDPRGIFPVVNVKDAEEIGVFVQQGRAFNELTTNSNINEIIKENDNLKAVVFDLNKNKMFKWNISKSIDENTTIYDNIIEKPTIKNRIPFSEIFDLSNDLYLTTTNGVSIDGQINKFITPEYTVRSITSDSLLCKYNVFRDSIAVLPPNNDMSIRYFVVSNIMHPNKNKLAMVLSSFPQINILDIETGDLKGYRLDGLTFSPHKRTIFYASACCDEKYIYALFNNLDIAELNTHLPLHNSRIHIFDWDGNLVKDVELDGCFQVLRYWDGEFYALERASGKIYTYRLNI